VVRRIVAAVSNLKGCQILAGGKAQGRHPRNSSGDKYDPGGVAESADRFISGTPARAPASVPGRFPRRPVVSVSLRSPAIFWHPSGMSTFTLTTCRG